ncbi:MAG: putative aconitase, partial [Paraglaciecola sp.]
MILVIREKTMKKTQALTGLYIIIAVAALVTGCTGTPTKIGADESYTVAWAESSGSISLRNSKDGLT